ncbi:MAG: TonB family protein [Agriterribacter sp.]
MNLLRLIQYLPVKKTALLLFGMIVFGKSIAQNTTVCYFNEQLQLVDKSDAAFEGRIIKTPNLWEAFALYSDGRTLMHGFFKDNRLTVKQGEYSLYYPSGKLHARTFFKEGIMDSAFAGWYENGNISDSGYMRRSLKAGLWKTWYEDGSLESEGSYLDGKPDSIWHWYHPNKKPSTIELYRKSKLSDLSCFDTLGKNTGSNCRIDKKPCPDRYPSFDQYVINNLFYPKQALRNGIEGMVSFEFFISKQGKLTRINFTNASNDLLQQEVVRLLKAVNKWEPAVSHNREIDYLYTYEVPFYRQRE